MLLDRATAVPWTPPSVLECGCKEMADGEGCNCAHVYLMLICVILGDDRLFCI